MGATLPSTITHLIATPTACGEQWEHVSETPQHLHDVQGQPVDCRLLDLLPHPSFVRHRLTVSTSKLSALAQLGDLPRVAAPAADGTSQPKPAYLQHEPAGSGQAANLGAAKPLLAVLFVDDLHGENGRMLERQIRARVPNANVIYVDERTAALDADGIAALLPQYSQVVAAVYSVPHSGRAGADQTSLNAMAMRSTTGSVLQNLLNTAGERTVVLAVGSPYTILDFPGIRSYLCTFSTAQTSEMAAVKAPVTLPDIAARGEGIDREASAPPAIETGGQQ